MAKEKFVYNHQTLQYEKVEVPVKTRLLQLFGFCCAVLLTGFLFTLISHRFFPSPQEKQLLRENRELSGQITKMGTEMENMSKVLTNIQDRDAYAHRMIFGMDPIDDNIWKGGIGGHEKYSEFDQFKFSGDLLTDMYQRMDVLRHRMNLQSKSLDTILNLAQEKEKMLASIPMIKPVRSDKLARNIQLLSGFGMRMHPIYKRMKMHTGLDFTAPRGTSIQAAGDGKIVKVENSSSGYGRHVIIDHGYGYQSLYGHMDRVDVKPGQVVKRGQKIGTVGDTGTSTAPHCHYEIIFRGEKVNPIHFCLDGLTNDEYQSLVDAAGRTNQSFD